MRPRNSILLSQPVTVEGVRYVCLSFRQARRRDLSATYFGSEICSGYRLIARLAGVPVDVIIALAPADLSRASNEVYGALAKLTPPDAKVTGGSDAR